MPTNEPPSSKQVGNTGEAIVAAHLTRLGWRILSQNFRSKRGEIDIIAEEATQSETVLVFVEVKTRRGHQHGTPAEAVTSRKQQKLLAVAQDYLAERNEGGPEPATRFDVAEVFVGADGLARVVMRSAFFGEN